MLCALSPIGDSRSAATSPPASQPIPRLRLDPLAWLKIQFFATTWDCAVGGFGLPGDKFAGDDPLHIGQFATVPQRVERDAVRFDSRFADTIAAPPRARRRRRRRRPRPGPFRVLILTHAGNDPAPTDADEALFARTLGHRDWSALLVIARGGGTSARLSLSTGPVRALPLAVDVDWTAWARFVEDQPHQFPRLAEAWKDEYARNVCFADELTEPTPASVWPAGLLARLRRGQLFSGGEQDEPANRGGSLALAH